MVLTTVAAPRYRRYSVTVQDTAAVHYFANIFVYIQLQYNAKIMVQSRGGLCS